VLRVEVMNVGNRRGAEVVQLYVRDEIASVARPDQQLVGFTKVELDPGDSAMVSFEVHPSRLAFFDEAMRFVTEPGAFRFTVGGSSSTTLATTIELDGPVTTYLQREIVATKSRITQVQGQDV
jgi:beta-glucosidase